MDISEIILIDKHKFYFFTYSSPSGDGMVVFERYIPWMVYAENRNIHEFYFTIPNKPGQLMEVLKVFAKHNINILSISAYALPNWKYAPVFLFADFSDAGISTESIKRELESATDNIVCTRRPLVRGFMSDEFAFPLYVFPGVRSIIMLELDFQGMIRGMYSKLGDSAAVFLYHLAYPGGKSFANYLSKRLKLKGKELLKEILKIYQAGGWARVELVEYDPHTMKIVLRLYDSIECKLFKSSKPMSQLIRGHLSGLLSSLLKTNVRVVEKKCIAKGDPYCEFYVEIV